MPTLKIFKPVGLVALVALAGLGVASAAGYSPFPDRNTSQTVLLKSVQDVSEYHAAIGTFEMVVDTGDADAAMPDFIAGRRTLYVAVGTVDAYIDLSGLQDDDITVSAVGKSAELTLPEPKLGKPNLDFDRSHVYSDDRGVVDRLVDVFETPQQAELNKLAETRMADAAEESELRVRAAENTKSMLTGLFGSLEYEVTFKDDGSG